MPHVTCFRACHCPYLLLCCVSRVQTLANKEALVGSWPGSAGKPGQADAALPFFPGRPIRTAGSNLSSMSGAAVQRTSSFNGGHPGSTRCTMGMDSCGGNFSADQLCFTGCNSAPITPRSPSYTGYGEEAMVSRATGQQRPYVQLGWAG